MTLDNSKSQIGLLSLKVLKSSLSFKTFEIQSKIRDLRLYYLTVQICTIYRTGFWSLANRLFWPIFFGLSFEGDF